MQAEPIAVSKGALWGARIITALVALFLLMDGVMKLVKPAFVVEETGFGKHLGTRRLG